MIPQTDTAEMNFFAYRCGAGVSCGGGRELDRMVTNRLALFCGHCAGGLALQ